ncbi:F-box domain-containing protein [Dioscorea alata]|uniref:F-box domain-containing protein n=1 Tax=Dioscorea alata TaxID=55571 RepID=A0ACB7TUE6_DIOAL|nr:F-box domain-containing protein [Dioscorea alata]
MEAMKRYEELGMGEALSRSYDYPSACQELALILRCAYAQLPKTLHSLLLRDTLAAFRLLPVMQTSLGLSAANLLFQAAEAVLPRQKKALAVAEFKRAVVAHKRRYRAHQHGDSIQLPQDILIHIFKFLDMRSLVTSSSVCWAWNAAANDNALWHLQYSLFFGSYGIFGKSSEQNQIIKDECPQANLNWKKEFCKKYTDNSFWRFKSNRAFCGHCKSIIWLSNITCDRLHHCATLEIKQFIIKPMAPYKVVEYLLGETMLASSSSDSDSDTEASKLPRLWAYPKLIISDELPSTF